MFDPQALSTALLAAVPEDGSSIGNQSLLEALKGQFGELTDKQFTAARDALIEGGQPLAEAYEIDPTRKLKKGESAPYMDMASVATSGHPVWLPNTDAMVTTVGE